MNEPYTQREIERSQQSRVDEPRISVTNIKKNMLVLQTREPGSDFFVGERSIYIKSGKTYIDRESVFNKQQLSNLKVRGEIEVHNN